MTDNSSFAIPSLFDPAQPVRLSDPRDLLTAIPFLLGHEPTDGLVIACFDEDARLSLTVHVPIPPDPADVTPMTRAQRRLLMSDLVAQTLPRTAQSRATEIVVVVYEGAGRDSAAGTAFEVFDAAWCEVLRGIAAAGGVAVLDVLICADGRWRSAVCTEESCCPAAGRLVPQPADNPGVVAELVGRGLVVADSREALAADVAPSPDAAHVAALARLIKELDGRYPRTPAASRRLLTRAWRLWTRTATGQKPADTLADRDIAVLILALHRRGVRDALLARAVTRALSDRSVFAALSRALLGAVRLAPRQYAGGVASTVAVLAWQQGAGALTSIALQRCLTADPQHAFGRLLMQVVQGGVHPMQWAISVADLDEETCLRFDAA